MSVKTILVAHQSAAVRERFAAALAEARHESVAATTAAAVRHAVGDELVRIDLAIVDLGLAGSPIDLVADVRRGRSRLVPVVVFAGSVSSADQVVALAGLGVTAFISEHAGTAQILPALAPHLFPDNFNRRASPRTPVAVPASFQAGGILAGARTLDLSRSGLAIRTMEPLPMGTVIELSFRLPGTSSDIIASGRVAWSDRRVGMGVQFERLSSDAQQMLGAFLENK